MSRQEDKSNQLLYLILLPLQLYRVIFKKQNWSGKQKAIAAGVYTLFIVAVLGIAYLQLDSDTLEAQMTTMVSEANTDTDKGANQSVGALSSEGSVFEVHFLDVGQALSVLITDGKGNDLLYDAGNEADADYIIDYLEDKGVDDLEYLINSHPHEDHIGGMDGVLEAYDVETVIMSNKTYDSNAYRDVISIITEQNIASTDPVVGEQFQLGSAMFEILGPINTSYSDTNNYSVVIKVVNGNQSILLTGDAEDVVEHELINANTDLTADILQVGHHGSDSSSTAQFLFKVDPKVAIISCGVDNKYGHPSSTVINRLDNMDVETHRTDIEGTVVVQLDGNEGINVISVSN